VAEKLKQLHMTKQRLLSRMLTGICLLLLFQLARAQNKVITGTVTDDKGGPLSGATVRVRNSVKGVNTDADGRFTLSVPAEATVLVVSYVGFDPQEVSLRNGSEVRVGLKPTQSSLNEVVVVGYGVQRRKDVTGSVASVKGSDIKQMPVTDVTAAIQGKAAGVEVIQNSGQPGGMTPTIIIRGLSSLHQPAPLYIVDGVRVPGDNINIQDIATIDILKDASAAAIYGSAAAGGVILITTKKGSGAKPQVNFNSRYGVTAPKLVELLRKNDYIKLENVINPTYFAGATQLDTLPDVDWVHTLYGKAYEQNYNLSVSGSSPAVNYLMSGFYNAQKGIFVRNYSNIGGIRVNTDYKLGNWIKIGEQLAVSERKTEPLVGDEAQLHNAPFRTAPIIPIKNENGNWGTVPPGYGIQFGGPNPLGAAYSANAIDIQNNLQGNVYAEVRLPLNLSFRTTLGYSYYLETEDFYQAPFNFGADQNPTNSLNKLYNQSGQLLDNFVLTYDQQFGKHSVNAVAGYEQITTKIDNLNSTVTFNGLPDYSIVTTSSSTTTATGTYDPNGLVKSYFGRVNYNFDQRYYLSGAIRQDANYTVFGPNMQKGVFTAASAGWNISDEDFFRGVAPVVSLLKLRGSYGSLGNSNVPPYTFAAFYGPYAGVLNFGNTSVNGANFAPYAPLLIGSSINTIANPNLHWETVKETNIGVDGELYKGKVYFSVEWYKKLTQNMLYALSLPPNAGYSVPFFTNIGSVQGTGVDILLGYKDKVGKLNYDITVTAGFNTNKVTSLDGIATDALPDGYNYYNNGNSTYGAMIGKNLTITKNGLPFGQFYGYKTLGIFQTDAQAAASAQPNAHAGDLIYYHNPKNGNTVNSADEMPIGNPNPKLVYGITIRLNYGNFDLAALLNGVAGVKLFNGVKAYEQHPFESDANVSPVALKDSYFGSNGLTSQPRMGYTNTSGGYNDDPNGNYNNPSSYFVENGAYIKLKNLQIGYSFSSTAMERLKIRGARIFVMGNNLLTVTKYSGLDPEVGSAYSQAAVSGYVGTSVGVTTRGLDAVPQYPQTRIYSGGIDINF
jgi:TonB-dependent starch-binding outer membrane protein SusC